MYNVKVTHYPSGDSIQVLDRVISAPGEALRCDEYGVIQSPKIKKEYNPFTGKKEHLRSEEDMERSSSVSMSRTVNKIYGLVRANVWEWFVTFTFNPEKVDSFSYKKVSSVLSAWLNNYRKRVCPDMRYLIVPELHKSGRWHFHGLFAGIDKAGLRDSGKRAKSGLIVFNWLSYAWGFTTVTRVMSSERASSYICKYISKDLCAVTAGKKRYWASRNLEIAQVEYLLLDGQGKKTMLSYIADVIQYCKSVFTPVGRVCYYELAQGILTSKAQLCYYGFS